MNRYIDAGAIVDRVCEGISCNECSFGTNEDGMSECVLDKRIAELPTADVREVVRGEWVATWHQFFKTEVLKCSAFNNISLFASCYCPNCGADMRERREEARNGNS